MSEGFDKEAEREKLREKFEAEQSAREQTEQMSELLLKGATMTNKHCGECGDPIFRHNGQEFCPTCERPVEADETEEAEQTAAPETEMSADQPPTATTSPTADHQPEPDSTPDTTHTSEPPAEPSQSERAGHADETARARPRPELDVGDEAPIGDLEQARTALLRTLTTYAQHAAASEDPRRARDYLAAAREAAETIAALDSIGR